MDRPAEYRHTVPIRQVRPGPQRPRKPPPRTPRRRRWVTAALMVGVSLASVTACVAQTQLAAPRTPASSEAPSPAPLPPPPPPPPPKVYWPLTGVESGAVAPHPALAVKIENSADSRPQTGLNAADIVWEEVVEGGITRFVAVYHSTLPPEIGPIRSVRPMDAAITAPLHGLLAFSGGQRGFVDAIAGAGVQVVSMDAGHGGFYRSNRRYAPHNVYANPADFLAQADPEHQPDPAPQFAIAKPDQLPSAVATGVPAAAVRLKLSSASFPTWSWNPTTSRWDRAEGTTPAVGADGVPLTAANVVVLRVGVVNTGTFDPAGNPVPDMQMIGSGEALVATGGRALTATWTKNSPAEPVSLTGPDGAPILLGWGNTWVELVPTGNGSVTVG